MLEFDKIKFLVLDVDGTLTDSGIYYDDEGRELKKFSTRDYVGVMAAHYVGIKVIIITGRESFVTIKRAKEMHVDCVYQGIKNKSDVIDLLIKENGIEYSNIGYIGDDLNDLASMSLVGFKACPFDACIEIKKIADYVSTVSGGKGAVQDVMRFVLTNMNKWEEFIENIIMKGY